MPAREMCKLIVCLNDDRLGMLSAAAPSSADAAADGFLLLPLVKSEPPRGRGLGSREAVADRGRRNEERRDCTGESVKVSVSKAGLAGGDNIRGRFDRLSELGGTSMPVT